MFLKPDCKGVTNKKETVRIEAPLGPIYLPNNPAVSELNKGKNINIRYIIKQYRILTYLIYFIVFIKNK